MKKNLLSIVTFFVIFIFSLSSKAVTYYWVGGTGNWSDLNHWATTSGGNIHPATLPDSTTSVDFDIFSFSAAGQVVTVNLSVVYCYNFQWNANGYNAGLDLGSSTVNCSYIFSMSSANEPINAGNATINCFNFFSTQINGGYHIINTRILTLNIQNIHIDEINVLVSALSYGGVNVFIDKATIGTDTCTACSFKSEAIHVTNAILKGINFSLLGPNHYFTFERFDFDTLEFATPGGTYSLSDTDTVNIHNALIINSQSGNLITLQNDYIGVFPVTLNCDMNTVCTDYVQLHNIDGSGAAQYYAGANSTDLGGNSGWNFQPCPAAIGYYWVGGTGNWSDLNHWATTSGGNIHPPVLPDSTDDVFFDANSFPAAGAVVKADVQESYCHNFDWSGVTNNPTFGLDSTPIYNRINIYGSFRLSANMTWDYKAVYYSFGITFHSYAHGNIIDMAGLSFSGPLTVGFTATAGNEWNLLSDFNNPDLYAVTNFQSGDFFTNGYTINSPSIQCQNGSTLVHLSSSTVNCSSFAAGNYHVDPGQAIINCANFNSGATATPFHIVNCTAGTSETDATIDLLTTPYFNAYGGFIRNGFIGSDVTVNTQIKSSYTHFGNVVCKGQHIFITRQDLTPLSSNFDTLIFNTPGSIVSLADSDTLIVNNLLIFDSDTSNNIIVQSGGPSVAPVFCGADTVCTDYIQLSNINAIGTAQFFAGANSIDLGGNSGWQFLACTNITNVWPGDANYDLTATNLDILYIGIAFGETGALRPGATNNWVAQPCPDWSLFYTSGVNMKNGDCDGNGVVEVADTIPVFLNYGLTHPARLAAPEDHVDAFLPALSLDANPDTVPSGGHVHVNIDLGTSAIPVDSIYGIAFTLNYDIAVIDTDSISVDFTNSWLGTIGTDMIGFYYSAPAAGQLDFAITRTDHNNVFGGYGTIASFDVVIEDNISTVTNSVFRLSNETALTYDQYLLSLSRNNDSIVVDPFSAIHEYTDLENYFSIYPNPASQNLFVASHGIAMYGIEIYDVTGQQVFSSKGNGEKAIIDMSAFADGVYNLRCYSEKGIYNHRIQVVHH